MPIKILFMQPLSLAGQADRLRLIFIARMVAHVLPDVNQNYPLKNDRLACKTSHLSGFSGCFLDTD